MKKLIAVVLSLLLLFTTNVFADDEVSNQNFGEESEVEFSDEDEDGELEDIDDNEENDGEIKVEDDDEKETFKFVGKEIGDDTEVEFYSLDEDDTENLTDVLRTTDDVTFTSDFFPSDSIDSEETSSSTRGINGNVDNRTKVTNTTYNPYSAVVFLEIEWPNGDISYGTGFMYWTDVIVTAGHNVYNYEEGEWANWITAYPGRNSNSTPYGSAEVEMMYVTNDYYNYYESEEDIGVIELDWDIGEDTGYFGARYYDDPEDEFSITNQTEVRVTGYPGLEKEQWQGFGQAFYFPYDGPLLQHSVDTEAGQSGSPIFDYFSNGYLIYAVHIEDVSSWYNGFNGGVLLDESLFNWITSFRD